MENECFRCGVSGEKVRLFDAISNKGIVKICADCNMTERLPLIKKATDRQIEESQRQKSVRDMLGGMNRNKMSGREMSLRELVDKNMKERLSKQPSDLIDNFHWEIQRIRRLRKITREQFAKGISEPESTVRMLEQGILPNNDYKIINKIEGFLQINLRKPGTSGMPDTNQAPEQKRRFPATTPMKTNSEPPRRLGFDRDSSSKIKIADLKEMKKKQEEPKKPIDTWEEERDEEGERVMDDEQFLDKEDFPGDEDFK